jgi:hypothetical protein
MTGRRLKRVLPYLIDEDVFCFTYVDEVAYINIKELEKIFDKYIGGNARVKLSYGEVTTLSFKIIILHK